MEGVWAETMMSDRYEQLWVASRERGRVLAPEDRQTAWVWDTCRVVADGADWLVSAEASAVPGLATAARFSLAVPGGRLTLRADAPGVTVKPRTSFDDTRRVADLTLDRVRVAAADREQIEPQPSDAEELPVLLLAGETIGAMEYLLGIGLQHARERIAFGRPIGSFQAIKHQLVDASLAIEASLGVCEAALDAFRAEEDVREFVSIAKSYVARAGLEVAHIVWQVLGGVAYRWDHEFHRYLRRVTTDTGVYGDAVWHNQRILELHETEVAA